MYKKNIIWETNNVFCHDEKFRLQVILETQLTK